MLKSFGHDMWCVMPMTAPMSDHGIRPDEMLLMLRTGGWRNLHSSTILFCNIIFYQIHSLPPFPAFPLRDAVLPKSDYKSSSPVFSFMLPSANGSWNRLITQQGRS